MSFVGDFQGRRHDPHIGFDRLRPILNVANLFQRRTEALDQRQPLLGLLGKVVGTDKQLFGFGVQALLVEVRLGNAGGEERGQFGFGL
jgi:hypothetical protein